METISVVSSILLSTLDGQIRVAIARNAEEQVVGIPPGLDHNPFKHNFIDQGSLLKVDKNKSTPEKYLTRWAFIIGFPTSSLQGGLLSSNMKM